MAASTTKMKLDQFMKEKDKIEGQIKQLYNVLDSEKNVGMDGPLVDEEQFPRSDVDVYSVRHARHEIICLQNDHKSLMENIEQALYEYHAEIRKEKGESMEVDPVPTRQEKKVLPPFLTVDRVDINSPANQAGLEVQDEVVAFGSITSENFRTLQDIGQLVQHSKGTALNLKILRKGKEASLSLTPQTWSGKGLLGGQYDLVSAVFTLYPQC